MRVTKFDLVKTTIAAAFVIGLLVFGLDGIAFGQTGYRGQIEKWRSDHEAELKAEDGWLTVVGLFWLKEGRNTIGSGSGYDVELTDNFKKGEFRRYRPKGWQGIRHHRRRRRSDR